MAVMQKLQEFVFPTGPKQKLQRLLNVSAIVVGYFYVWTFQEFLGIKVAFIDVSTLLRLPIIAIVVYPLVKYAYVKQDWLQRGRPNIASVRFFQLQFPSLYIRDRCARCVETVQTCRNFIGPESRQHNSYWLDYIFPIVKKNQPEQASRTFERGYICKLIFGLQAVLILFIFIAIATVGWRPVLHLIMRWPVTFSIAPKQIIFVLLCVLVAGLLRALNSPSMNSPTGCWHAWREINDAHKLWMKNNETTLVNAVCHAGGNNKSFVQRP
jgi:hypothetical protein